MPPSIYIYIFSLFLSFWEWTVGQFEAIVSQAMISHNTRGQIYEDRLCSDDVHLRSDRADIGGVQIN